jgi:RimJ/RimL family protein N-acetyltransferase
MIPVLQTARLSLRPATLADAPDCFVLDSDPEVMRYLGGVRPEDSLARARERLASAIARHEANAGFGLGVCRSRGDERFIGWFILKPCVLELQSDAGWREPSEHVEVGYRLARAQWGKGYATEMGQRLVDFGFDALALEEIVGVTHLENRASRRVLSKLGLEPRGRGRYRGEEVDVLAARRGDRPASGE